MKNYSPPKFATQLLSLFTNGIERREKLGDLEEGFLIKAGEEGLPKAELWYWTQVLLTIPISIKNSISWGAIMLKNYLKIAVRNILKQKGYSFINVFGLALGIACCIFIFLWVHDELNFDRYNENIDNIYRIEQDYFYMGDVFHVGVTPTACGPAFKDKIPEVENACRWETTDVLLSNGDTKFYEAGVAGIDSTYTEMFTLEFLQGNEQKALNNPYSIIINDEVSQKYFGNENPIGKTLTINNRYDFTVTGVFKKLPANLTYSFNIAFPFDFLRELGIYNEGWRGNYLVTFVQLTPNVNISELNKKLTGILRDVSPTSTHEFMATPLSNLHLHSYFGFGKTTGDIQYLYIFSAIAVFVLLIACINFMNLSTARSIQRSKEIGLRKVIGAKRSSLIMQFLSESMIMSFIGLILALVIVLLLLGSFNELTGKEISLSYFNDSIFLFGLGGILLLTGILSGSYPALYLSSFNPISVLQGLNTRGASKSNFRRVLVVTQFTLSVFLIIGTVVVYNQMTFMKEKDLGYDKENLVYFEMRGDTKNEYQAIKNRFEQIEGVVSLSAANHPPYRISSNAGGAEWDGQDPEQQVILRINYVDYNFCKTMDIELLAGRDFTTEFTADIISDTDTAGGVLVNEEVVKLMGLTNASAIGARLDFISYGKIIGVMKNFHFGSIKNEIKPLAMALAPDYLRYMIIRLAPGNYSETLSKMGNSWNNVVSNYPFEYKFLDGDFDRMYKRETRMLILLRYFALLAIIIACLGIFGLVSFTSEQRTKEFGVRKVLGASGISLINLICREFVKLVLISNLIAWPIIYYFARKWLDEFAYKTELGISIFLWSGILSMTIALLTVGYQALKAANQNPVNSLKYE